MWIMACWWFSPIHFGPLFTFPWRLLFISLLFELFHILTAWTSWSISIKRACITDCFAITWSHHFTKRWGWANQIPPLFTDIFMSSKEIRRSCILVLWVSILPLSLIFLLYFDIVLFYVFQFTISLLGECIYQKIRLMSVF
jgi:hypothetical protein